MSTFDFITSNVKNMNITFKSNEEWLLKNSIFIDYKYNDGDYIITFSREKKYNLYLYSKNTWDYHHKELEYCYENYQFRIYMPNIPDPDLGGIEVDYY